jgi:hypothetical protein
VRDRAQAREVVALARFRGEKGPYTYVRGGRPAATGTRAMHIHPARRGGSTTRRVAVVSSRMSIGSSTGVEMWGMAKARERRETETCAVRRRRHHACCDYTRYDATVHVPRGPGPPPRRAYLQHLRTVPTGPTTAGGDDETDADAIHRHVPYTHGLVQRSAVLSLTLQQQAYPRMRTLSHACMCKCILRSDHGRRASQGHYVYMYIWYRDTLVRFLRGAGYNMTW